MTGGPDGGLGAIVHPQLVQDVDDMTFHRTLADSKYGRYLLVSVSEEMEIEIAQRAKDLMQTKHDLGSAVREVGVQKQKLEELRCELQEVNKALLALSTQMTRTREELEVEVAAAVRTRILPILTQLEADPYFAKYRTELEMLSLHLGDLSCCFKSDHVPCTDSLDPNCGSPPS